jgi:hypothetical protein
VASDEVKVGIMIVFFVALMALIPPLSQLKSEVNSGAFKQIKIRKLAFMFRAPDGISVLKEGIALPLLIMQAVGYLLAFASILLNILFLVLLEEPIPIMVLVTMSVFVAEVLFVIIFTEILKWISHPRKKSKTNKQQNM